MTFQTLIRRSLRFHWRSHLGVVLGAAIGSAALIGALVVGDSVRESLRAQALERLGRIHYALLAQDRTVTETLAYKLTRGPSRLPDSNNLSVLYGSTPIGILKVDAVLRREDGSQQVNHIQVFGDPTVYTRIPDINPPNFWLFADQRTFSFEIHPGEVWLNRPLANQLGASKGEILVLRIEKHGFVSSEVAISRRDDRATVLRLRVAGILSPAELGNLNLRAEPRPALNAFVNLKELQAALNLEGRINLIAIGEANESKNRSAMEWRTRAFLARVLYKISHKLSSWPLPPNLAQAASSAVLVYLSDEMQRNLQMKDFGASLAAYSTKSLELRSSQVFIDPPLVPVAIGGQTNPQPILTYLATLLHAGTNATPYSMVTAAGAPWTPPDMRDDEILVSQWLAEDLQVKPGDPVALSYFLPESGAKLTEATNTFRVRRIVPPDMPWADQTLMPDFPGIEKAESTSEWDAGFPLTYKVRPKDDAYWKQYRGSPKAFITLAAGQKMWGNRFGNLTAIRFPIPTNAATTLTPALSPGERENSAPHSRETKTGASSPASVESKTAQQPSPLPGGEGQGEGEHKNQTNQFEASYVVAYKEALEKKILANLKPEELGLRFEPVREQALKAAAESQDFGGLFLGFSFFVIGAALLLMALLFSLGLEQRAPEIGTLLALGFTPKQVRSLLLREGVALAFLGGVIGALGGLVYAKAMLHGLTTIWRDAVGTSSLSFHFTTPTLLIGLLASVVVSGVTIWLTLRKFVKRPARELLVGEIEELGSQVRSSRSKAIAIGALLGGVGLAGWAVVKGDTANAGIFFGAGALVLVAGLGFASTWLAQLDGPPVSERALRRSGQNHVGAEPRAPITWSALAIRGCARRRKRSLGTIAMLACGSFLIVSIGVFRLDANRDATMRSSGTGGFALIGETTIPVVQDLNSKSGRESFALNESELGGMSVVPFRVREGDEASCLNLNAAQRPRLVGVKPENLEGRFTFAKLADGGLNDKPWFTLKRGEFYPKHDQPLAENEVAAIGDANSIQWAMHKKLGDTIDYVDERGQPFKVRIIGAVANSILQGQLIIDEAEFVKRFPGESGHRMFLLDTPSNTVSQVSATLSRALQDVGLELSPAAQRLDQFNAVQNTYLGTFQVLGGLGLLLGSVGLGIVVLRNVLERRGELAVLIAVGFRKPKLQQLLLIENGMLLAVGLGGGLIAAAVAVTPAWMAAAAPLPYASLTFTLAAVVLNGAGWTWLATRAALRGDLLAALRNE